MSRHGNYETILSASLFAFIVLGVFTSLTRNSMWIDPFSIWENSLIQSPKKPRTYVNLGTRYYFAGLNDKALEKFTRAVELAPWMADAHYGLAAAYAKAGLVAEAIKHYEIALQLNPYFTAAHLYLGRIYLNPGVQDLAKAKNELEAALALEPYNIEARQYLGYLATLSGRTARSRP